MNKFKGLSYILLFSMMGISFATVVPLSIVLYNTMHDAEEDKLIQISNASLKPVVNLSVRSVNGANKMKLRNKDAQNLYESAGLLYLHIKGMSEATSASVFVAAQSPREIEYEYRLSKDDPRIEQALKHNTEQYLDEKQFILLIRQNLSDIKNGGQITAIFSADSIKDLNLIILQKMALPVIVVFIFVSVIAVFLGRWISKPISDISNQISVISHSLGLSSRIEIKSSINELITTTQTFNHFLEKVENIIRHLTEMSDLIQQSAMTLTKITFDTQQRISLQDSQTDQATTSMTEMTAVAENVNTSANTAAQTAQNASQEAQLGMDIVNQTVTAIKTLADGVENATQSIQRVEQDSNSIGGVLDVIRGIAEQTNLLALNAAIEAARAGESGRGFAVVADEVRTLANRTQESTQEIQQMVEQLQAGTAEASSAIGAGQQQAQDSVEKANKAGDSLQTITQSINTISNMNNQIALSVREQSKTTAATSQNISQIANLSRQSSEDSATTAESSKKLSQFANQLKQMVEQFKLNA